MGHIREVDPSLLVVACFSRHPDALSWAEARLCKRQGPIALRSPDFDFHQTRYYEATMGPNLKKRFVVFDRLVATDSLPDLKLWTNALEGELAQARQYADARPLNLDPGLIQLGKFLLATTKDQAHRIYLRDGVFAEAT